MLHGELTGIRPADSLTWLVNVDDGWADPFTDTVLEPPLFTWIREAGGSADFREFELDDERFRGFIRPTSVGQGYVTLAEADARDDDLAALDRRLAAMALGVLVASGVLGVVLSGLSISPMRRLMGDQQSFLADAAHEMRTPLAVIMASSSQALARPRSSEEYVRSLSEIRSAAERAATGVNEMLDLVRFESGQTMPRVGPLRLDLLAEEIAAAVRPDDAEIVAEPSDPVVVAADMALLRQAIENVQQRAARRASRGDAHLGRSTRRGDRGGRRRSGLRPGDPAGQYSSATSAATGVAKPASARVTVRAIATAHGVASATNNGGAARRSRSASCSHAPEGAPPLGGVGCRVAHPTTVTVRVCQRRSRFVRVGSADLARSGWRRWRRWPAT
ncbi:MAG: HAMP domain-containing sensor histidine kinase [Ilumatobacteraceae bacterium]